MRERIQSSDTVMNAILKMSEGNPGAISVLTQLLQKSENGFMNILSLDDMNIRGSQIWVAYNDHCRGDLNKLVLCLDERDPALVDAVNACHDTGTNEKAVTSGGSYRHA